MDIRIYTDVKDPGNVLMDLSSLIHVYQCAKRKQNHKIEKQLASLFVIEEELISISKDSEIYSFIKQCPDVVLDQITWDMVKESYLIARFQNNMPMLRSIGKILGHWGNYLIDKHELEGLEKEMAKAPSTVREFILKYHNSSTYEEQQRRQSLNKKETSNPVINRSVVEIGNRKKIYKKAV